MKRKYVILDRDGTINVNHHYLSDPERMALLPGSGRALRLMQDLGMNLIVATNQSAIGRGLLTRERLTQINNRMIDLLGEYGVALTALYYCPHTPEDHCHCRKPQPGMIEMAAKDFNFDPQDVFVIGDNVCDVQLAKRVGAISILVTTGFGAEVAKNEDVMPDYIVTDLLEAARLLEYLLAEEYVTV